MISFIVPAHNEERLIGATLDALLQAAKSLQRAYEIIVVNDASTDRTAAIAHAHGVRVVAVNLRHIAAVRNAGAAAATGDLLIFIDADTLVNAHVIRAAVRAVEAGAVGGGALLEWDGRLPLWAHALAAMLTATQVTTRWAAGCFVFATREAFHAAGGFDERVYATEEIFLSRALKRQGRFVMLRERVRTSGRKLRTYSMREFLALSLAVVPRPMRALGDRRHLDIWYGKRRHDDDPRGQDVQ